ncbi:uncharacterized protein [Leptinotarsa decemlineata]|uniref:uncharacterized protein n=1 Tax=Leptinotarsa decemlineata TaxID=7539 RepID=UPI003D30A505
MLITFSFGCQLCYQQKLKVTPPSSINDHAQPAFLGEIIVREDGVVLAAAACVVLATAAQRRHRRYWVKQSLRARTVYSGSDMLNDLQEDDRDPLSGELRCDGSIKNFLRMTSCDVEWLIGQLGHRIGKKDTNYRKDIPVKERLAVTLRFLATEDSFASSPQVLDGLIDCFEENVQVLSTPEEWLHHAKEYLRLWNFPHCIGAMDGKHVMLQAPIHTSSDYFNYKEFFSIVLLALVDAN